VVGLSTSYTSYQSSEKQLAAAKESVELSVTQAYWEVLLKEEAFQVAAAEQQLQQREWRKNQLFAQAGTISDSALRQGKTEVDNAQAAFLQKQLELDAAYRTFNTLVRLPLEDRPQLTDTIPFQAMAPVSLDYHITKVMEEHPELWTLDRNVQNSKASADLAYYQGGTDPYRSGQIGVEQAALTYSDAKKSLQTSLYTMYDDIRKQEQAIALAEGAAQTAKTTYAAAQLQYEWGTISQLELLRAELSCQKAEYDELNLKSSYNLAVMKFEKPWL
jgi:outer membrane protein TolC